jgi:hypothetical protein
LPPLPSLPPGFPFINKTFCVKLTDQLAILKGSVQRDRLVLLEFQREGQFPISPAAISQDFVCFVFCSCYLVDFFFLVGAKDLTTK